MTIGAFVFAFAGVAATKAKPNLTQMGYQDSPTNCQPIGNVNCGFNGDQFCQFEGETLILPYQKA